MIKECIFYRVYDSCDLSPKEIHESVNIIKLQVEESINFPELIQAIKTKGYTLSYVVNDRGEEHKVVGVCEKCGMFILQNDPVAVNKDKLICARKKCR